MTKRYEFEQGAMDEVSQYIATCSNAVREYRAMPADTEVGRESNDTLANLYAACAQGAYNAMLILMGRKRPETAYNDVLRQTVVGIGANDSDLTIEATAQMWNKESQ